MNSGIADEPGPGLVRDANGQVRCEQPTDDPRYLRYHDEEWGRPVVDDDRLFEKVCLEGFQSGLSWSTILYKRDAFRDAFAGFAIDTVANYDARSVARLMRNDGIVRNRRKIEATIHNAKRARELRDEAGSLGAFFWSFEPDSDERPRRVTFEWSRANPTTPASIRLAGALKARGWKFVGPTTMHALMQALGLVNDHVDGCATRAAVEQDRQALTRPR